MRERETERRKRTRQREADRGGKKTFFFFLEEFCPDSAAVGANKVSPACILEKLQNCSSPVRTCFLSSSLFLSIWKLQTAGLRYSPHKTYSRSGQKPLALGVCGGGAGLLYGKP